MWECEIMCVSFCSCLYQKKLPLVFPIVAFFGLPNDNVINCQQSVVCFLHCDSVVVEDPSCILRNFVFLCQLEKLSHQHLLLLRIKGQLWWVFPFSKSRKDKIKGGQEKKREIFCVLLSIEEILRDHFKKNRKKNIYLFTRKRVIEIKKWKAIFSMSLWFRVVGYIYWNAKSK